MEETDTNTNHNPIPITPDVWGPHGWKFLHYVTLGYPNQPSEQEKQSYRTFFNALGDVLPCKKCSNNFKENLNEYSLESALENRGLLIKWLIDIHNAVNSELNKPIVDYDTALSLYIENEKTSSNHIYKVIVLICLLFFIYHFFKK